MGLIARLRAFLAPSDHLVAPLVARVAELERQVARLVELEDAAVERELRWTEMNAQLRRYLGRLDAHAGRAGRDQDETPTNAHAGRAHLVPRSDVIAAKFPNGLPAKE